MPFQQLFNLFKLLLAIKVEYTFKGTEISYKGARLIFTGGTTVTLIAKDFDIIAERDVYLDASGRVHINGETVESKEAYKVIENPVAEAYAAYLENGTDYMNVLLREQEKSEQALREISRRKAIAMQSTNSRLNK